MPVRKFRSVDEMSDVAPRTPLGPENLRIACELSELARRLRPFNLEPGVRNYVPKPPGALVILDDFEVPDDFDDPLPEDVLRSFES